MLVQRDIPVQASVPDDIGLDDVPCVPVDVPLAACAPDENHLLSHQETLVSASYDVISETEVENKALSELLNGKFNPFFDSLIQLIVPKWELNFAILCMVFSLCNFSNLR